MIRKATPNDAKECVKVLELAMSEFTEVIFGESEPQKKMEVFERFFKARNNRLSFENVLLYEKDFQICAAMCVYAGYESDFLDMVLNERLKSLGKELILKECEDDEFYIDSIAVLPKFRGQGYFKALMNEAFSLAKEAGFKKVSLITLTPEIYTKFGFEKAINLDFYGEIYAKMIKNL
ncbi:MAG: GNAT family N-acetyltransferase [Campylobacteraceae bacterium]|nr:GNAT family N-acetyltransferase [Campylobacteraceae bacterium]